MSKKYDYLIVGSGLYGATCAYELSKVGKKVLVLEKRSHIGGNIYCKNINGINVHEYGAHIFHTSDLKIWNYVNELAEFNNYINSPIANYNGELYNLPFNMNTFTKLWSNVITPKDAMAKIESEKKESGIVEPQNLEEQAISLVGKTIYDKLIKGYTQKQWGKTCRELPAFIIKRLPVRFTFDNNYFNDRYQGIPIGGYTLLVEKMLDGIEVQLNTNFFDNVEEYKKNCKKIIYTGALDEYFNYSLGHLEYRSLKFDTKIFDCENYQGNAVVNYTGTEVDYTRVIEHKHFEGANSPKSVVTFEYPSDYEEGMEKYYTINDEKNNELSSKYKELAEKEENVIFVGRLAEYKYYDMDDVIKRAFDVVENLD